MESRILAGDLVLRFWAPRDEAAIDEIVSSSSNDFDVWLPDLGSDLSDFERFIERSSRSARDGTGWYYGVEFSGVLVGQCSVEAIDAKTAEIGYWIRSDRTHEGLATQAVNAMLGPAAVHGYEALIIRCDEGNERSAAVARKAGFTHTVTTDLDGRRASTDPRTGREMTWHLSLGGPPNDDETPPRR